MKRILILIMVLGAVFAVAEQKPFPRKTIASAITSLSDHYKNPPARGNFQVSDDSTGIIATVRYTGETRELPPPRKLFLRLYWVDIRQRPKQLATFQYEIKVQEGDEHYWFPIPDELLTRLNEKAKPGDDLDLQLLWGGSVLRESKRDWIFLVNEFATKSQD